MYTRVVEITSKPGKARELCSTIEEKVVPILKKTDRLRGRDRSSVGR